jgi:hypothetical protein
MNIQFLIYFIALVSVKGYRKKYDDIKCKIFRNIFHCDIVSFHKGFNYDCCIKNRY